MSQRLSALSCMYFGDDASEAGCQCDCVYARVYSHFAYLRTPTSPFWIHRARSFLLFNGGQLRSAAEASWAQTMPRRRKMAGAKAHQDVQSLFILAGCTLLNRDDQRRGISLVEAIAALGALVLLSIACVFGQRPHCSSRCPIGRHFSPCYSAVISGGSGESAAQHRTAQSPHIIPCI